jgi:hypothetical protein
MKDNGQLFLMLQKSGLKMAQSMAKKVDTTLLMHMEQ